MVERYVSGTTLFPFLFWTSATIRPEPRLHWFESTASGEARASRGKSIGTNPQR